MKVALLTIICIACLLITACKKVKPITYSGRLLFTHKYPTAVASRNIAVDQIGYGSAIGIASRSTASNASTTTDLMGNFQLVFTPGTATFLVFSGASSAPLTLRGVYGDSSFQVFSRTNFPDSGYDASKPIYIGKTVDTAIITVQAVTALSANDTLGINVTTLSGQLDRRYTGRVAPAGSVLVLDTIYNALFTNYDGFQKGFTNTLYAGRRYTVSTGYFTLPSGYVSPSVLSTTDQSKEEFRCYFSK